MELHAKANLGQEQRKTSIFHIFKFSSTHGLVRDLSLSLLCLPYDYTRPNLSKIPFLLLFGEEGGAWILPPFPYCPISSFFRTFLLLFFLYFSLQLGSSICCIQPFSSMHAPYRPTPPPPQCLLLLPTTLPPCTSVTRHHQSYSFEVHEHDFGFLLLPMSGLHCWVASFGYSDLQKWLQKVLRCPTDIKVHATSPMHLNSNRFQCTFSRSSFQVCLLLQLFLQAKHSVNRHIKPPSGAAFLWTESNFWLKPNSFRIYLSCVGWFP
jgi:hypothetical protein